AREDHGAGVVGGELGASSAYSRELRRVFARRVSPKVARSPRSRTLHRVLHRLRRCSAETLLWTLFEGRGHWVGPAAAGAAQCPARRRQLRTACRTGVAARPDQMDAAVPAAPRERVVKRAAGGSRKR